MSGDTKTRNRNRANADRADPHAASRQDLQNALLKDYLTNKQSPAPADKETVAARLVEQHESSAARLETLLEAARQQKLEKPDPAGKLPAVARPREPERKRLPAAPARPPEVFLAKSGTRTAGEGRRAETEFSAAVDVDEPPSGATVISFPRLAIRTAVVAVVIVASAYAVLAPHWTDGDGANPVDVPNVPAAEPAAGVTHAAAPAAEPAAQVSAPEDASAPVTGPVAGTETARPSSSAAASDTPKDEAQTRSPVREGDQASVRPPAEPLNTPNRPETARSVDSAQPSAPAPATASAGQEAGKPSTTAEHSQAARLPPPPAPPPSPREPAPAVAAPGSASGDRPAMETATVDDTPAASAPVAGKTAASKSIALEKRAADKRPYFQRLGPHPPSNPFRATFDVPAPPPAETDFFRFFGEVE